MKYQSIKITAYKKAPRLTYPCKYLQLFHSLYYTYTQNFHSCCDKLNLMNSCREWGHCIRLYLEISKPVSYNCSGVFISKLACTLHPAITSDK